MCIRDSVYIVHIVSLYPEAEISTFCSFCVQFVSNDPISSFYRFFNRSVITSGLANKVFTLAKKFLSSVRGTLGNGNYKQNYRDKFCVQPVVEIVE